MNPAESSSSSLEKSRVLPGVIAYGAAPALVIAFGTAGIREGVSANGGVVVGRRTFVHDPLASKSNRQGLWSPPSPDQLVDSAFQWRSSDSSMNRRDMPLNPDSSEHLSHPLNHRCYT
ncbi:MAG TPA: hypothetical protein VF647_17940 [Longimicrobium sp.]|jgi:hypothetical protein